MMLFWAMLQWREFRIFKKLFQPVARFSTAKKKLINIHSILIVVINHYSKFHGFLLMESVLSATMIEIHSVHMQAKHFIKVIAWGKSKIAAFVPPKKWQGANFLIKDGCH